MENNITPIEPQPLPAQTQPLPMQTQPLPAQAQPLPVQTNQWLWVIAIVVLLFVMVAIFVSARAKKARLAAEMGDIQENIETGRGGVGNTSIGNAINDTKPDESYPYALDDAQKICNAGGYYGGYVSQYFWSSIGGTNAEKIKAVFVGKTKGQVAAILEAFAKTTCNSTLDAFMQSYLDEGERKQIYQIIKSAK